MSKPKPSVQMDVARLAGVSSATVSRVLNNSNQVKPEIRQRVEKAMEQLNYMPNAAARSLASKRTRTLGAIIPTLNNAIFAQGINAFENAGRALDYTLVLSVSNYNLEEETRLARKMIERNVDGLLLVGNGHEESTFAMLREAALRHVCVWAYEADTVSPNIGFSNSQAMWAVVDHLVELGHSSIGLLAGHTNGNDRAHNRLLGTRERLEHHGIILTDNLVIEIPYSIREARKQFRELIKHKPTAIICGNDVIAVGAILEAQAMGLSIPNDIAITGFDNLPLASELSPGITTVDVQAEEMGSHSAKALINAIENKIEVQPKCFETNLVIRGTTVSSSHHKNIISKK